MFNNTYFFNNSTYEERISNLEDKYVRTTRFATISSGTSGTVTLPANSTVVLDDFGGTTDAVISAMDSGRPTYTSAYSSTGAVVATTFDSSGNYVLSAAPTAYPVAIIYRVQQPLADFDSTSSDILGNADVVDQQWIRNGSSIYYASGNVGIASSSPTATLQIGSSAKSGTTSAAGVQFDFAGGTWTDSNVAAAGTIAAFVNNRIASPTVNTTNSGTTVTAASNLRINGGVSAGANTAITNSNGLLFPAQALSGTITNSYQININGPMTGATNNYAMTITGNCGFGGVTDPTSAMTIAAGGVTQGTSEQLDLRSQRAAIISGNMISGISFTSNDTSNTQPGVKVAFINAIATVTHTASALDTALTFSTTVGTTTAERVRINSSGIGIGVTPTSQVNTGGNISAATWGLNGIGYTTNTQTFTDTTATGVPNVNIHVLNTPTLAATNVIAPTSLTTLFVAAPLDGTNVTTATNSRFGIRTTGNTRFSGLNYFGPQTGVPAAILTLAGDNSSTTWTTGGRNLLILSNTLTDTSGTGTIGTRTSSSFGQTTFASSNAVTLTDASSLYLSAAPAAGTNTTITNSSVLLIPSASVGASVTNSYAIKIAAQSGATNNYAATITGNVGMGGVTDPTQPLEIAAQGVTADTNSQLVLRSQRAAIVSGNLISGIVFKSNDTSNSAPGVNVSSINVLASATHTASVLDSDIVFSTTKTLAFQEVFRLAAAGNIVVPTTVTAGGTTGNQTINKISGTVNFAAAATAITVTNSLVTANSIVMAVVRTNDTTAVIKNVVPAAGSFVINLNAAATDETSVGFFVIN